MAKKQNNKTETLSFRIDETLAGKIEARVSNWLESSHAVARRELERYYEVLQRELASISLTESEANLLCDVCNGTSFEPIAFVGALYIQVEDGDELEGVGEKWGVDAKAFAEKLKALSFTQCLALVDAVERFWIEPNEPNRIQTVGLVRKSKA
jgi:hypothetical protein